MAPTLRRLLPSLALALGLIACGERTPEPPDAVYRVRGQVVAMHGDGDDRRVIIAHETMPEFADRNGVRSGMPAMRMAFGIANGVEAQALVPGSQWEVAFEVHWKREPALRVVAVKPLPPDTRLELPADTHDD